MFLGCSLLLGATQKGVFIAPPNSTSLTFFLSVTVFVLFIHSVDHHLFTTKSLFLFLNRTEVREASNSDLYSAPSYIIYPKIQCERGSYVYVTQNINFLPVEISFVQNFPTFGMDWFAILTQCVFAV